MSKLIAQTYLSQYLEVLLYLTPLPSERPKLHIVLAFLSAKRLICTLDTVHTDTQFIFREDSGSGTLQTKYKFTPHVAGH